MTMKDLRFAGPGKFQGGLVLDEVAYVVSLDGADAEIDRGDDSFVDWIGLLSGPIDVPDDMGHLALTDTELRFLKRTVGCIVFEDNYGFVMVEWHTNKRTLMQAWRRLARGAEKNCA